MVIDPGSHLGHDATQVGTVPPNFDNVHPSFIRMCRVQCFMMVKDMEFYERSPPRRMDAHQQLRSSGLD